MLGHGSFCGAIGYPCYRLCVPLPLAIKTRVVLSPPFLHSCMSGTTPAFFTNRGVHYKQACIQQAHLPDISHASKGRQTAVGYEPRQSVEARFQVSMLDIVQTQCLINIDPECCNDNKRANYNIKVIFSLCMNGFIITKI